MRELYEAMVLLNQIVFEVYGSRVYSELLMKRISGFSIPSLFKQCHSYFFNAVDDMKRPKEERKAQDALKRRYDVKDIEAVSLDLIYLKSSPAQSQIMSYCFSQIESDYLPEHFYSQEFAPTLTARIDLYKKQI